MKKETAKKIIREYAIVKNGRLYWRNKAEMQSWTKGDSRQSVIDELYYALGKTWSREAIRRMAIEMYDVNLSVAEMLSQYHEAGSRVIDSAYELFSSFYGVDNKEEWLRCIDISEIDRIDFMYNTNTEEWASDDYMAEWTYKTFRKIID